MLRAIDHFDIKEALQTERDKQRQKWFIAAREQRERKEDIEAKAEDEFFDYAVSEILATQTEIANFQAKLDTYDEATTLALMENTEALAVIQGQLDTMLDRAFVMEDGRKVFKSEDGTWAVDQDGNKLNPEVDSIEAIPQTQDTAETYLEALQEKQRLELERQELHDYQDKLDNARERSNSDDFTKEELDELEKELEADMPQAVKQRLPDYDPSQEIDLKADFSATAKPAIPSTTGMAVDLSTIPTPG